MSENKLEVIKRETLLQTTNAWIKRLSAFATSNDLQFTKYQEAIVVNTVRKIQESGLDIFSYEQNNVADVLYQTAFLNLNPSAVPRHCYFIERGYGDKKKLELGIEGDGNDEILRNFGLGIKRDSNGHATGIHKAWIIREFDEYEEGYFNGLQYQPPKWKPHTPKIGEKKGRVIRVVYPIEKTDGTVEYYSADREDLQPIISKHIEQNLMGLRKANRAQYNEIVNSLRSLTFDQIIEKYQDTTINFTDSYGKKMFANVIQDSYTGSTGEAMLIRKLKNVAVRQVPKNFNTTVVAKLYENTFEEKYDKPSIAEITEETLKEEIEEKANVKTIVPLKEEKKSHSKETIMPLQEQPVEIEIAPTIEPIEYEIVDNIQDSVSIDIDDDLADLEKEFE